MSLLFFALPKKSNEKKATLLCLVYSQLSIADLLTPSGALAMPTLKMRCILSFVPLNLLHGNFRTRHLGGSNKAKISYKFNSTKAAKKGT
ncbi:hypothetical protein [Aggregatibacter kilianii]|uniref:hypothetical protein n=1 Tax=Aggregatibacter kilianii TaxID=2025884 RepID=UPI00195507D1|nr:hypothetical protein [Aggregatibacter kilianii]